MKKAIVAGMFWVLVAGLFPPAMPAHAGQDGRSAVHFVATIHPLAAILKEVTGGRAQVSQLLPSGGSPHTFEPRPSDVKRVEQGSALFYAGPGLDKEWIARLPAAKKIEMLALVPESYLLERGDAHHPRHEQDDRKKNHGNRPHDPHFWTDPLTVGAMLPGLIDRLAALDPDGARIYRRNALKFKAELESLDRDLRNSLQAIKGKPIVVYHPSFQYFFKRYDLELAGVIEPFPGREPTPRYLHRMVNQIRALDARAIFNEPQLPSRPALVLAEAAGVMVYELDPLGGGEGRATYEELLRYNAGTLLKALH